MASKREKEKRAAEDFWIRCQGPLIYTSCDVGLISGRGLEAKARASATDFFTPPPGFRKKKVLGKKKKADEGVEA